MPLLAAILHPPLALLFQKGEQQGLGMRLTVGVSNFVTAMIFVTFLRPDWSAPISKLDLLAMLNGAFFFAGQWFAVKAVKSGDLVVHSSALGTKLLFVAAISLTIGLEKGSSLLLLAVVLSVLGIFLVAGGNLAGWKQHSTTVKWTLVGVLSFAISDVMTSNFAVHLGQARWLQIMMLSSASFSVVLLLPRRQALVSACKHWPTLRSLASLSLLMGVQAVLINIAFSQYREPTVSNVVFALRGLTAILFLMLLKRSWTGIITLKTAIGSALVVGALLVAAFA